MGKLCKHIHILRRLITPVTLPDHMLQMLTLIWHIQNPVTKSYFWVAITCWYSCIWSLFVSSISLTLHCNSIIQLVCNNNWSLSTYPFHNHKFILDVVLSHNELYASFSLFLSEQLYLYTGILVDYPVYLHCDQLHFASSSVMPPKVIPTCITIITS